VPGFTNVPRGLNAKGTRRSRWACPSGAQRGELKRRTDLPDPYLGGGVGACEKMERPATRPFLKGCHGEGVNVIPNSEGPLEQG
jgi:hypothetical protein